MAACCALPGAAHAAPWSFIVEPTEQIGVPGFPAAAEITPEGYLYTGSAEIVWRYGNRQRPWNVPIRTLADGRYPVINSSRRDRRVSYGLTTFAAGVGGQAVNFVRVRIHNGGSRSARVGWSIGTRYTGGEPKGNGRRFRYLRPVTPARSGLYYQPGYGFNASSVHRFAGRALLRDGRALYVTHSARGLRVKRLRGPRKAGPTALVGVTRYSGRLRAGRTIVLDFTVPTVPVARPSAAYTQIASARYPKYKTRVMGYWRRLLGRAMDVHIPEPKVEDTFYASLMNLALSRYRQDGYWIQTVNRLQYHAFWLRDAAAITAAFDRAGLHDIARQDLDFFLTWQQPDGLFISRPGQYDGFGQALWAFGDHVRRTNDVAFAQKALPAVARAMAWLARARSRDPLGLLPPSDPHDNELVSGHLVGDNLWGVAGAKAAATIARAAGEPASADRWAAEAAAYQATLDAQIRQAVKSTPGGWIPVAVDAKGGQDWGNLWPVYPTGVYSPSDDAVERTMRHARARFEEGIATYLDGRVLHHYLGFRVFQTDLAAGNQARAVDGLYAALAHTTATNGGFETGVRVYGSRAVDDNMTPHGWFAAEYVTFLRNMLVRERADGIALMSALSPSWLQPGEAVSVHDAPTTFGDVSFTLRATDDGARLEWHADVPKDTPIHWPLPDFAKDVKAEGLEKDGRTVLLPRTSGTLTVKWRLGRASDSYARTVERLRAAYRARGR